mmetsp:Transcript_53856/g.143322  ORF Transcript_53856/g.143322 Transcript_53856/m.143322 type:complete len:210 (+) Transcript_53856:935-1564(+)
MISKKRRPHIVGAQQRVEHEDLSAQFAEPVDSRRAECNSPLGPNEIHKQDHITPALLRSHHGLHYSRSGFGRVPNVGLEPHPLLSSINRFDHGIVGLVPGLQHVHVVPGGKPTAVLELLEHLLPGLTYGFHTLVPRWKCTIKCNGKGHLRVIHYVSLFSPTTPEPTERAACPAPRAGQQLLGLLLSRKQPPVERRPRCGQAVMGRLAEV